MRVQLRRFVGSPVLSDPSTPLAGGRGRREIEVGRAPMLDVSVGV
jgi:hypothetical protein